MSEYTREEILKLIEENSGPEGLDLSGKDLNHIDLSTGSIQAELRRVQKVNPEAMPKWWWGALDHEGISLRFANLREANLDGARLQRANLEGANLQGANLSHARLQEAYIAIANLQGARLKWAHLQVNSLWQSKLQGAHLEHADLRRVDLKYVKSLRGAFFYGVCLGHTDMDRSSLGPAIGEELTGKYSRARDAYLRLKQNFDDLGDYAASAWAYQKERQMEKMCSAPWRARRFYGESQLGDTEESKLPAWHPKVLVFYARHAGKWLWDWVAELVCSYGEGLWRVVGTLIFVWIFFALIYGLIAGVWGPWQDTGSGKIRYITRNPIDLLSFSLGAMTTLEPIGLEARPILAMRILAPLEALLGIFFVGLLGFVAGKRIRRA